MVISKALYEAQSKLSDSLAKAQSDKECIALLLHALDREYTETLESIAVRKFAIGYLESMLERLIK